MQLSKRRAEARTIQQQAASLCNQIFGLSSLVHTPHTCLYNPQQQPQHLGVKTPHPFCCVPVVRCCDNGGCKLTGISSWDHMLLQAKLAQHALLHKSLAYGAHRTKQKFIGWTPSEVCPARGPRGIYASSAAVSAETGAALYAQPHSISSRPSIRSTRYAWPRRSSPPRGLGKDKLVNVTSWAITNCLVFASQLARQNHSSKSECKGKLHRSVLCILHPCQASPLKSWCFRGHECLL